MELRHCPWMPLKVQLNLRAGLKILAGGGRGELLAHLLEKPGFPWSGHIARPTGRVGATNGGRPAFPRTAHARRALRYVSFPQDFLMPGTDGFREKRRAVTTRVLQKMLDVSELHSQLESSKATNSKARAQQS